MEKRWFGELPKTCDICKQPLREGFVDGATVFGPWANMCLMCHRDAGRGLGTGRGQRYDATGKKVEG